MYRPLIQKQINELEQLVEKSIKIKDIKVLKNVFEELEIRKSLKKRNTALKETYQFVDNGYHLELINDVLREQPTLTKEQVQSAVLMKLIKNEKSPEE